MVNTKVEKGIRATLKKKNALHLKNKQTKKPPHCDNKAPVHNKSYLERLCIIK